jgi:nucleoid DNA-binding protein
MNKTDLINQIAESADISKKAAADALQAFMATVTTLWKRVTN